MEALGYRLQSAELLLDNCEHLLDACAQLASRLLRDSPRTAGAGYQPRAARPAG